jgi:hypothetical protein
MNVKNIVRKAVALGSGAALVGTTLMGAMAYDLSTYPAKFIVDGKFDGKIIVGEKAATTDVLGSIDIAASLQGASVSKIPVAGAAGKVSLSGENFELGTGSDMIELREPIGDVVDTVTASDLPGLKSGQVTTSKGSTDYNQYLRLKDASNLQDITINYVENDDDVIADYMVVDTSAPFLEWEIQFPEGLESDIDSDETLEDLEDRSFNIMGTDFTVVTAELTNGDDIELTMMGGSVPDTLREGETKTYTINGQDYEVTLVFVSDPSSGSSDPEVKFSVNGEITQSLAAAETDTLSGGLQIGVRDVLVNAREGVASFFLGADKLVFTDTTTLTESFGGAVEINDESINDGDVAILGSNSTAGEYELTSIKYRITMDAADGTTAYIPKGHGVKELMKRPDTLISDTLDLKYEGLTTPQSTKLDIAASGDDEYEMTFTNILGQEYTFPLLSNKNGVFKFGDSDDDLVFVEGADLLGMNIGTDDYFIVSNDRGAGDADKSVTNILRYEDYDSTDRTLEFEDLSSGSTVTVPVASDGTGSLVIGGHTYAVNVSDPAVAAPTLGIDLNADGAYGDVVNMTAWGGLVIDPAYSIGLNLTGKTTTSSADAVFLGSLTFGHNSTNLEAVAANSADSAFAQSVTLKATVLAKNFDTSDGGDETFNWTISEVDSGDEVDLSFAEANYNGPLDGSTADVDEFQFRELDSDDDHQVGMTDYGVMIDLYSPSGSNEPDELSMDVPKSQRFGQVFVTLGSVTATQGQAGTADRINPIAVGLAVLDKDAPAVGTENMIVVGGPCANSVASELMGSPADCAEGFETGKAMIKSSEKTGHVAILVAGMTAQDTLGASRVLASYKDYALKGTEAEVVVADLNSIKVQSAMN